MDLRSLSPLLETLSEGFIVVGPDLVIKSMNAAAEEILGLGCEGLYRPPSREVATGTKINKALKQTISAVRPQHLLESSFIPLGTYNTDGKVQLREAELPLQRALRGEMVRNLEIVVRNRHKPEGIRLNVNANPITDAAGNVIFAVGAFTDISAAHINEQRHNIFRQVFAQTQEAIVITDGAYIVQYANQAYWDLTGYSPDKILNRPFAPQQEEFGDGTKWLEMQNIVKSEGRWTGEFVTRKRNNEVLSLWATMHAVVDTEKRITNFVLTLADLTSLKSSQEELFRLVSKDPLTGLSNRREFFEQLEQKIERAKGRREKFALLFLDLGRFKELNDTLGHQAGDKVLQKVASRLAKIRQQDDPVARLGGDEFAIVVSDCANEINLGVAIEGIRTAIETPMTIAEHSISITVNIGVAAYPDDGEDAATLAKNVDIALASADTQGGSVTRFFTQRMFKKISRHFWLESHLRHAFGNNQLIPYFQPQLNLQNNKPEEAEVLIRWNHPEAGLINPGEFIPVAERTGLIGKVTTEIMEASCLHMARWKKQGFPLSCLAINITANLLLEPNFVQNLCEVIERHALKPSDILIEITESSAMDDPERTGAILKQMKNYGVLLAIDDFGTGYSSLAYLRKFAVDQIKIDQSFIRELETSQESRSIVMAIIRMCDTLGFETLAEGIETPAQAKILTEFGCKKLQGYLIAKPLNTEEFQNFMNVNGAGLVLGSPS